MKTVMVVLAVVVVLTVGLFIAAPWSRDYADQTRKQVDNGFRDRVDDDNVINNATQDLKKAEEYLRNQYVKVVEGKEKLASLEGDLRNKQESLSRLEAPINRASEWLATHKPGDTLLLGGRQYDYATVLADAKNRTQQGENLRTTIVAVDQSKQILGDSVRQAENNSRAAIRQLEAKKGELQTKSVMLASWRTIQATRAFSESLASGSGSALETNTRYLNEVDRRIRTMKADFEFTKISGSGASNTVAWDEETASQNDVGVINQYRQKYLGVPAPVVAPTPAASANQAPSANASQNQEIVPFSTMFSPVAETSGPKKSL